MAEDSKKAGHKIKECIDGIKRLKAAVDEINKGLDRRDKDLYARQLLTTDKPIGKVIATNVSDSVGQWMAEELGYNCRCVMDPLGTPRHSGRYPWTGFEPLNLPPTRKPSPGFIFANKDWIKSNMSFTINWTNDSKKYIVRDGNLTIFKEFPYSDLAKMLYKLDSVEAFEDYIISELAREYDNIMTREVMNMDINRANRFISMLNAAGGHFSIEGSTDVNPMAKIEIPCNMLYHLHIDGDGSTPRKTNAKIPGIRQIQTFNDRVVQVTFIDGSQTKCVCGKDETFDLYEGVAFCLFKRFLDEEDGTKHFNDLMRYAFKKLDEQEEAKKRKAEIEAENKRREEKKKLQAQRRKEKKREEKISIFVDALKRNRQALINSMPSYCVPNPAFKPDENPEKEG